MTRKVIYFLSLFLFSSISNAQIKIGFVDLQKALVSIEEGKKAKAKLEKIVKDKQKEFDRMQEEIKSLKEELEEKASIMKDELKRQKLQDYQKKLFELQEYYLNNQKEIMAKEAELTKPIFDKMQKIIKEIAEKEGWTFILERAAVIYGKDANDITGTLIKIYDSKK